MEELLNQALDGGTGLAMACAFAVSVLLHFVKGPWRSTVIEILKGIKASKNPTLDRYLRDVEIPDADDYPEDN